MQEIIDNPELQKEKDHPLDAKWIKALHDQGTILRETLSNDIGTRRQPFLQTKRVE